MQWRTTADQGINLAFKVYAQMEETNVESPNLGTGQTLIKHVIEVTMQYNGGLEGPARASWSL